MAQCYELNYTFAGHFQSCGNLTALRRSRRRNPIESPTYFRYIPLYGIHNDTLHRISIHATNHIDDCSNRIPTHCSLISHDFCALLRRLFLIHYSTKMTSDAHFRLFISCIRVTNRSIVFYKAFFFLILFLAHSL